MAISKWISPIGWTGSGLNTSLNRSRKTHNSRWKHSQKNQDLSVGPHSLLPLKKKKESRHANFSKRWNFQPELSPIFISKCIRLLIGYCFILLIQILPNSLYLQILAYYFISEQWGLFYSISTKHFAGYLIRFSVLPEATFAPRSQITLELRPMNSFNPRLIFP